MVITRSSSKSSLRRNLLTIMSLTFGMAFFLLSLKFFVLLLPPELIIVLVHRMIRLVIAVHRVFVESGLTVGIAAHGTASGVLRRQAVLGGGNTPCFLRLRCLCVPIQINSAPPISSSQKVQAVQLI